MYIAYGIKSPLHEMLLKMIIIAGPMTNRERIIGVIYIYIASKG